MEGAPSPAVDWHAVTRFDSEYQQRPGKTNLRIWREAYGDGYPAEAEPHSFVTKTDLARIVDLLAIGSGNTLIDLGCGRGGPGLWLARATGADLIGIDLSPNAIAQAKQRVAEFGLVCRYADFFRQIGEPELGMVLCCEDDFHCTEVGWLEVELTRTQTIMEGALYCDFRWQIKVDPVPEKRAA